VVVVEPHDACGVVAWDLRRYHNPSVPSDRPLSGLDQSLLYSLGSLLNSTPARRNPTDENLQQRRLRVLRPVRAPLLGMAGKKPVLDAPVFKHAFVSYVHP
jgi:hypothetical protein